MSGLTLLISDQGTPGYLIGAESVSLQEFWAYAITLSRTYTSTGTGIGRLSWQGPAIGRPLIGINVL
ncbi:MAG TPA: hypothetical protein DEA94_15890 [Rhodobacteraceae bacterium]|nr:hypothetical protein [Paracoccaceae bacterium]